MELKKFIKATIKDVVTALEESELELKREIHIAKSQDNKSIEFDLAVTTEKSENGEASVDVLKILGLGGKIGSESKNSSLDRIKFGAYVNSSTKEVVEKRRKELSN